MVIYYLPKYLERVLELVRIGYVTPEDISKRLNVSISTARKYLDNLRMLGLVIKKDNMYIYIESVLQKLFKSCEETKNFVFYTTIDKPKFLAIRNVIQLWALLKYDIVDSTSLAYSIYNGYLQKWLSDVLNENELANKINDLIVMYMKPEGLREKLLKIIEEHINSKISKYIVTDS